MTELTQNLIAGSLVVIAFVQLWNWVEWQVSQWLNKDEEEES